MKKKLQLLVSSAIVSLTFATFQATYGADDEASSKEGRRVISQLVTRILPQFEEKNPITTKCQRPIEHHPQARREIEMQGSPIRQTVGEEKILHGIELSGEDGRIQVLKTNEWPNGVHGVVYMTFRDGTSGWGSGTLIAPNLVLTAAHNLYGLELYKGKAIGRATGVEFFPAKNGKTIPGGRQSVRYFYYTEEYTQGKNEDYGLLILENPVGEKMGYFGISVLDPDQIMALDQISVTGYPGDKEKHEMWGMGSPAANVDQNFIDYEIDTFEGQSGSGVWYQEGENYFVIGIHVAGDFNRPLNKATVLTRSRYAQIRKWVNQSIEAYVNNATGGKYSTVEYVDLNHQYIGSRGVKILSLARYLRDVHLSFNYIEDDACQVLAQHPTITNLDLSNNNITDEGTKELIQNPRLLSLDLSWNYINLSEESINHLAQNSQLRTLNLSNNRIENAQTALLSIINANNHLEILKFSSPYNIPTSTKIGIGVGATIGVAGGVAVGAKVVAAAAVGVGAKVAVGVGAKVAAGGGLAGGEAAIVTMQAVQEKLGKYRINQEKANALVRALDDNKMLRTLDLSDVFLTNRGKAVLNAFVNRNPKPALTLTFDQ